MKDIAKVVEEVQDRIKARNKQLLAKWILLSDNTGISPIPISGTLRKTLHEIASGDPQEAA